MMIDIINDVINKNKNLTPLSNSSIKKTDNSFVAKCDKCGKTFVHLYESIVTQKLDRHTNRKNPCDGSGKYLLQSSKDVSMS